MHMQRNKSQHARLIELDRRIRAGNHPNCLTFGSDWGVSQKTVQRDIDFLRDQLSAPIAYNRERKGFFYENTSWVLPSVILTEGELLAVLLASRVLEQYAGTPTAAHLARVFNKLSDLLPKKISLQPELLFSRFSFRGPPAKPIDEKTWSAVVKGLLQQRVLKVIYHPFETHVQKDKTSRICPWHIANLQGEWYVFAVHEGHDDVRQFALSRIAQATVTHHRFSVSADFDPAALLDSTFARYAGGDETHNVRLLFKKDIAEWITERQWHPCQSIKPLPNGDLELGFPAKGLYEVQRWVLSWGRWVKVLAPNALVTSVADEVREMHKGQQ